VAFEFAKVFFFVYCFLLSIDLMGTAFKASKDYAEALIQSTANPFISLVIGIVATSVIQSSSTTTSIVVAMVAAELLPVTNAVPIIMGANIGTTVTNTIVSFGYVGRKQEFERSFCASIVHDMFNIYAVILLFPLELYFGFIQSTAVYLEKIFEGMGGLKFASPFSYIVDPVTDPIAGFIDNHWILLIVALGGLFFSMSRIVSNMKGIVMEKIESVLNRYLFRNVLISMFFGALLTATVQSSSITTSIIIPLVGAGVLTVDQIFPYTLGANLGTTITAMLAAMSLASPAAITIAMCHLTFNVFGIVLLYPVKALPIRTAKFIASYVSQSKKHFIIFIVVYILLHIVPILFARM
jgi:solute carrier family 34 (sodium-dependent phosphate cotransporter)